jgi:hypothetical protein
VKIVNRKLNHLEHIQTFKQVCTYVMFTNQNNSQLTSPWLSLNIHLWRGVKRICSKQHFYNKINEKNLMQNQLNKNESKNKVTHIFIKFDNGKCCLLPCSSFIRTWTTLKEIHMKIYKHFCMHLKYWTIVAEKNDRHILLLIHFIHKPWGFQDTRN